jgi:hypothetical protein
MADIFLISAGVLATSATVLAFMTDWSHGSAPLEEQPGDVRQKTAQRRTVRVQEVGFTPLPSGGFVNLGGTF